MRDFRDAKAMAQTLRDSLVGKTIRVSHSESLELVSKMLGLPDWNTLSALIQTSHREPAMPAVNADRPARYPAIPIRDFVPFPSATFPLFVGREKTIRAIEGALQRQREVVLAVQKDAAVDDPGLDDVHEIGVLAGILDLVAMDDGTMKLIAQAYRRVAIRRWLGQTGASVVEIADLVEGPIPEAPHLVVATIERFRSYAQAREIDVTRIWPLLIQIRDPGRVADFIGAQLQRPLKDRQELLITLDPLARLQKIDALMAADLGVGAA